MTEDSSTVDSFGGEELAGAIVGVKADEGGDTGGAMEEVIEVAPLDVIEKVGGGTVLEVSCCKSRVVEG